MHDRTSAEIAHVEPTQADRDVFDRANIEWAMGDANVGAEIITAYRIACVKAAMEAAAVAARCHFDDRPRRSNIDWTDGYDDAIDPASVEVKP